MVFLCSACLWKADDQNKAAKPYKRSEARFWRSRMQSEAEDSLIAGTEPSRLMARVNRQSVWKVFLPFGRDARRSTPGKTPDLGVGKLSCGARGRAFLQPLLPLGRQIGLLTLSYCALLSIITTPSVCKVTAVL